MRFIKSAPIKAQCPHLKPLVVKKKTQINPSVQDIGGLLAGMFRNTAKERASPAVTVTSPVTVSLLFITSRLLHKNEVNERNHTFLKRKCLKRFFYVDKNYFKDSPRTSEGISNVKVTCRSCLFNFCNFCLYGAVCVCFVYLC